ncbi:MAG TPA: MgtC/SapB family protein [Nocardioides sp.]|uniref:MgtC/SapB family protein n=1 Tax=Nocardioides sp. TaxID=35761 RepID=UPI002E375041|nr:MgtC/SapB family protein [Nocardioides sp.]HEX3929643.1 MgtC/SapB family protein [Nocardioides sp.]
MSTAEIMVRLGIAFVAGLAIGAEREYLGHAAAGMRTHVLVAMGAAMFSLGGVSAFGDTVHTAPVDPTRIAAQVASGIGFIGAGAIIRDRAGIRGLTTAATLWLAASVGVGAALGAYRAVAIGTAFVLVALVGLRVRPQSLGGRRHIEVEVEYPTGSGALAPVLATIRSSGTSVGGVDVRDDHGVGSRRLRLELALPPTCAVGTVISDLAMLPGINRVQILDREAD